MSLDKVFAELWNKSGGHCVRCGKKLGKDDPGEIDHIVPRKYGGTDQIENLRLVCRNCNMTMAGSITESEFVRYIYKLLLRDARFDNVSIDHRMETSDGQKISLDIIFTQTVQGKKECYIVEAKSVTAVTAQRIDSAIQQLTYYQRICPKAHLILAVPTFLAEEYRKQIHSAGYTLWDVEILRSGIPDIALSVCTAPDQYDKLIEKLKNCQPGFKNWQVYQKLVGEILSALFCPPHDHISEQNSDANLANRRDFIIPNYATCDYWLYLRQTYKAEFIVVDAKNSAEKIGKGDILQVAHYLKEKGAGLFSLIFSRYGPSKSAEIHLRDIWQSENKMIVVLDDSDVEQMLLSKQCNNDPCQIIIEKIQEFRLKI